MVEFPPTRGARTQIELTGAAPGETITVAAIDNRPEAWFCLSRCDYASVGYHCVSCKQALANVGQLTLHVETGGRHHVAVWCPKHRLFEAMPAAQVQAFQQMELGAP